MRKSHLIANKRLLFCFLWRGSQKGRVWEKQPAESNVFWQQWVGVVSQLADLVGRELGYIKRRSTTQKRSLKLEFATVFDICSDFRRDWELGGLLVSFGYSFSHLKATGRWGIAIFRNNNAYLSKLWFPLMIWEAKMPSRLAFKGLFPQSCSPLSNRNMS